MDDYVKNEAVTSMKDTRMEDTEVDKMVYHFTIFVGCAYFVNTFLCIIFTIIAFTLLQKLIGAIFLTITLCRIIVCLMAIFVASKC